MPPKPKFDPTSMPAAPPKGKGLNLDLDTLSNKNGLTPTSRGGDGVDIDVDINKNAKVDPEGFSADTKRWFSKNKGKAVIGTIGAILVVEGIISSAASAKCLDDCLPTNYKKSEESGLGLLSRDEMIYQTENDPHCSADNPDCMKYCTAGCDDGTWAEGLGTAVGATTGAAANAAGKSAGEAAKGVLGGLGIGPIFIAVIVVIIIIVFITMM